MEFEITHEFAADPDLYWELFFDAELNAEMFRRMRMKEYSVMELRSEGDRIYRTLRLTPTRQIPAPLRRVLGGEFSYTERDVFTRSTNTMDIVIEPSLLRDRFDMRGVYSVRSVAPGRLVRSFKGSLKISIPVIGGQAERFIYNDMKESYEEASATTREWLARWRSEGKTRGVPPQVTR